jgi:hypothetical protein
MARAKSNARSKAAWGLANRQHGILARRDLLALGFTPEAIDHRIAKGRLHPVGRGVYAVGWPHLTRERRWIAAVLACGEGAALSHRSAGSLWGITWERPGRVDVSVRRRCEHRRPGIHVRSRPALPAADVVVHNDIPVTAPARTLTGQPGVRALRALLDRHTFRLSDSDLELFFRPIATAAGLPPPLTKEIVNDYEVDFFWPELHLVVETDGLRYHRTASTQTRDRERDQAHTASGLTQLRFSHYQVRYEPSHVRHILARTAQRLRPRHRCRL